MKAVKQVALDSPPKSVTGRLPDADPPILSFEEWHHVSCREHSVTHLTTTAPTGFRAHLATRHRGRFVEGYEWLDTNEMVGVERDRRVIAKDREHPYVLFAVLAGELGFEQNGRSLRASAGDVFLYDQGLPFTMGLGQTRRLAIQVPRGCIDETIVDAAGLVSRLPDRRAASTRLARSMLDYIAGAPANGPAEAWEHIAHSILHLFSAGFNADRLRSHIALPKIKAWMRARSDQPGLDVAAVSRAFGISGRTISRLFAADGTTPMRWLWRERLFAARDALARPGAARVSDVATATGFSDPGHFSRAFKQEFGHAPSAMRSSVGFAQDERGT